MFGQKWLYVYIVWGSLALLHNTARLLWPDLKLPSAQIIAAHTASGVFLTDDHGQLNSWACTRCVDSLLDSHRSLPTCGAASMGIIPRASGSSVAQSPQPRAPPGSLGLHPHPHKQGQLLALQDPLHLLTHETWVALNSTRLSTPSHPWIKGSLVALVNMSLHQWTKGHYWLYSAYRLNCGAVTRHALQKKFTFL